MKVRTRRTLTINPFVSEAQKRWMYANDPEMASEWQAHTPKSKKLPKRKKPTTNKAKVNPLRYDPTRTFTLRKQFDARVRRQFDSLKAELIKLILHEDAFGLLHAATYNRFCATGLGGGVDLTCGGDNASTGASLGGKIADKLLTVGAKVYIKIVALTPKAMLAGAVLAAVFDTPTDMEKAFYNPASSALTAGSEAVKMQDPMQRQYGISTHLACTIASHVLGRAFVFAKHRLTHNEAIDDDALMAWVEIVRDVFVEALKEAGCDLPPPTEARIVEYIRSKLTTNTRWVVKTDPEKVKAFQEWLARETKTKLTSSNEEKLWEEFTQAGYVKGAGRAFDDVRAKQRALAYGDDRKMDFYAGTREEFLRSSFGRPVAVEKVKLLAGRSFTDVQGVTSDMSTKMNRKLVDGLIRGASPREVAKDLAKEIDIASDKASAIARTEIIRAHAEGQLSALRDLGIEEVGVQVEWSTAGDDKVCEECEALEGSTYSLDDAQGMLPLHPNCRCAWIPAMEKA